MELAASQPLQQAAGLEVEVDIARDTPIRRARVPGNDLTCPATMPAWKLLFWETSEQCSSCAFTKQTGTLEGRENWEKLR